MLKMVELNKDLKPEDAREYLAKRLAENPDKILIISCTKEGMQVEVFGDAEARDLAAWGAVLNDIFVNTVKKE